MLFLTRKFIALATQLPESSRDNSSQIIMGLLEDAGQSERPKVLPVPLFQEKSRGSTAALYSVHQGQNVGRRSDFADVYRLGGRVVNRSEPPAHGVLETSAFPKDFDVRLKNKYPWPVSQVLWVDGATWITLVRDGETWRERERFLMESLHNRAHNWMDAPDKAIVEFYEFLHRALLRWDQVTCPDMLARYIASHARSYQPHDRLDVFAADLTRRCGFSTNDEELMANIIRATEFLEQVRRIVASADGLRGNHTGWPYIESDAIPALRMLIEGNMPLFDDNTFVASFCRVFLAELFATKELPEKFDQESSEAAAKQVAAVFNALPDKADADIRLVDGNAGYGDYLLSAIGLVSKSRETCSIIAYEANPVACQVARLRVACALKARDLPTIPVELHNMYRDGITESLAGTCVFFGEASPHVIKGASLEVTLYESHKARYGWGKKLQNQDIAIAHYLDVIKAATMRSEVMVCWLSLRVPVEWAEDANNADSRKQIFSMTGSVFVDDSGVNKRLIDRRMSRGDVVVLAGGINTNMSIPAAPYARVSPLEQIEFSLVPGHSSSDYATWPALRDLFLDKPLNGPIERRGMTMLDIDRKALTERLTAYFSDTPSRILGEKYPAMITDTEQFNAEETRARLRHMGFTPDNITRYLFRPFDARHVYVKDARPLFSEPATALFSLADMGDSFLVASAGNPRADIGVPTWFGAMPCDYDFFAGRSGHFPVWVKKTVRVGKERREERVLNISDTMREYLHSLGFEDIEQSRDTAELLWLHVLAVTNTPRYLKEHREALRLGWPRIPIPGFGDTQPSTRAKTLLERSASLGRRVAELLSFDDKRGEHTSHEIGQLLVKGRPTDPENVGKDELAIAANWGIKVEKRKKTGVDPSLRGNAVRPRPGHIDDRPYWPGEMDVLEKIARDMDSKDFDRDAVFGKCAIDVKLNDYAYWAGVPESVWKFVIGGRRVLSKWLSYREVSILDRPLVPAEIRFFGEMVCRLTKLRLLGVELDRHWEKLRQ